VDVLITDLVMPEQEGIELIMALRKEAPGIGIVAISGAFDGRFLELARQLGAQSVLRKPVSPDLLLAKVAELLKSRA
jgi:CheY-like chemotaxis protein